MNPTLRPKSRLVLLEILGFVLIIFVSFLDEHLRLPQRIFGKEELAWWHEFIIEFSLAALIAIPTLLATNRVIARLTYLEAFLRLCAWCKKIRVGDEWMTLEEFLAQAGSSDVSHGICEHCSTKVLQSTTQKRTLPRDESR